MGQKDAKLSEEVSRKAATMVHDLAPLGDVTAKAMFGGQGIFESGIMFAMVRSDGTIAVRGDDMTSGALIEAGGTKHGRMPYWTISDETVADIDRLLDVAGIALETARRAKKSTKNR